MKNAQINDRSQSAVSLLQLVATIAIIGTIAAIAIPQINDLSSAARITKLESDVATVNQSLKIYLANGGILTDVASFGVYGDPIEQKVLDKLKTRRNSFSAATFSGLKGEMIDSRLAVRMQTDAETASEVPRAVWNSTTDRFIIANSGTGVREFYINAELAKLDYGIDEGRKESAINVNEGDGWIWAYDSSSTATSLPSPTLIPVGGTGTGGSDGESDGGDDGGSTGGGETIEIEKLHAPIITPRGGTYPVSAFPLLITINNPNVDPSTWIMFSINHGPYAPYEGSFTVESRTSVRAYIDGPPDLYLKSSYRHEYYTTKLRTPSFRPSYYTTYPMTDFPKMVEIRNYNDPSTWVMYSINGGEFQQYSEPFQIDAETTVAAYVESPDEEWERSSTRTGTYHGYLVELSPPQLSQTAPEFNEAVGTILITAQQSPANADASSQLLYAIVPKDAPPPDPSAFLYYLSPVATNYSEYPTGFTFYAFADSLDDSVWSDSPLNDISTSVDFFGVGVAQSTLFILDFSGSMEETFYGTQETRLQVLKAEMQKALGTTDLDENDRFGVIIFSSGSFWVTPSGLLSVSSNDTLDMYPGTTENKTQISGVISATADKRYTNFLRAFSAVDQVQPPPEQIIFLTDGTPTVGDGSNEDINNEWLAGLNEVITLGIPVYTIGVDLKKQSRVDRLEYISEQTGGTTTLIGDPTLVPDSWTPPESP